MHFVNTCQWNSWENRKQQCYSWVDVNIFWSSIIFGQAKIWNSSLDLKTSTKLWLIVIEVTVMLYSKGWLILLPGTARRAGNGMRNHCIQMYSIYLIHLNHFYLACLLFYFQQHDWFCYRGQPEGLAPVDEIIVFCLINIFKSSIFCSVYFLMFLL